MSEPGWISKAAILLLHNESLAEHGGRPGLRDEGSLVARLAAAYGLGITKNHPFVDGNKRAAFLAIGMFLAKNGYRLAVDKVEATRTIFALASGDLEEEELASWIRAHLAR